MGVSTGAAAASFLALLVLAALGPRRLLGPRALVGRTLAPRPRVDVRPVGRPIEAIAADVHRLGPRFRSVPSSFTRFEARRRAYDGVLAEACCALEVPHLLGVLPPGVELDRERVRVEAVLDRSGFHPTPLP